MRVLAESLVAKGAEVQVLTSKPPTQSASEFHADYRISRWPVLRDQGGNVRGYIQYLSFDLPVFFRLLFSAKTDVYVVEPPPTTGLMVAMVSMLRRTPFVYYSADVSSSAAKGIGVGALPLKILTWLERLVLRRSAGILTVSAAVKAEIEELIGTRKDIWVVGTGVDTDTFSFEGIAEDPGFPYFLYAGTMSEIQGTTVFVEGFKLIADEFPELKLLLFGQGTEVAELQALTSGFEERIAIRPPISGQEIARWFRGAKANLASVRPSRGYDFAFATKALAGMSAGVPCIYAGVGPMRALIDDNGLGWTADWTPASVAEAFRKALREPFSTEGRNQLAGWTEEHHSLKAVGTEAASRVLAARR
nr:glycosyltransferase [Psychromicrobium silvestre]